MADFGRAVSGDESPGASSEGARDSAACSRRPVCSSAGLRGSAVLS